MSWWRPNDDLNPDLWGPPPTLWERFRQWVKSLRDKQ